MEPTRCLISYARNCGGGSVTLGAQRFIWDHCISKNFGLCHAPYLKNFVKKLLSEIESDRGEALDELYELYTKYVTYMKEEDSVKGNSWALKHISFLFPEVSRRFMVPLQCSLNMLEGDTGCSIWPSSVYLSELILSHPEHFSGKSCFEVGSGVGLVGVCLAQIKASKVVLTDGDPSSLVNLGINLKLNNITPYNQELDSVESMIVKCVHLSWESVTENVVLEFSPDIILGADVIYDPLCLPHLVRLLAILLCPKERLSGDSSMDRSLHPEAYISSETLKHSISFFHWRRKQIFPFAISRKRFAPWICFLTCSPMIDRASDCLSSRQSDMSNFECLPVGISYEDVKNGMNIKHET